MTRTPLRSLAAVLALLLLLPACAQDLGLIDRVQPGALDKRVFEGEFFLSRTVVDVPYHVGYTFVGETEELERVRFVVREDQLVAYRSYDFIAGTDLAHADRSNPGKTVQGTPVAVWPIVKHFDVQRTYNEATGEQSNVLVENDSDRPWYERRYIRVNWAQNATSSFMFTVDGIDAASADSIVTDPSDPDAFTVAWRDASGPAGWSETRDPQLQRDRKSADYIDFVTKVVANPVAWDFWDPYWGPERYPACWFFLNEDCKAAEIEVRTALLRVDPVEDTDYAPLAYPDNAIARDADGKAIRVWEKSDLVEENGVEVAKHVGLHRDPDGYLVRLPWFDKFGYFRTERYGYDDKNGEVDSARQQMINRFNIWQRHHGDDGKLLPYAQRTPKPIVYYLTPGFPSVLRAAAQAVADGWDDALRKTVAARQGKAPADVPRMFELRDNTQLLDSDGSVVDRGQRVGDLRYSLISLVDEPTRAGLLGYGPSWADPVTGRVVAAGAHMYGGPLRRFATSGRDLIRLVRGELDPEEYGLGRATADEVIASLKGQTHIAAQAAAGAARGPGAGGGSAGKRASGGDKAKAAGRGAGAAGAAGRGPRQGGGKAWFPTEQNADARRAAAKAFAARFSDKAFKQARRTQLEKSGKGKGNWAAARLGLGKDHPIEAFLATRDAILGWGTPDLQAKIAALPPGAPLPPLSAEDAGRVSPRRWAGLSNRWASMDRERLLRRHNMLHAAFVDDAVLGIAKELEGDDPEVAWSKIYAAVFRSTAEHEVGHTLGLRHNFEASTDAMNWHGRYWELRGETGKPLDTPTAAQLEAGMDDHRYSSIMEYAGRFHADMKGLGRYDYAAIAFGYGELVEVWGDKAKAGLLAHGMTRALWEEARYLAVGDPSLADPEAVIGHATRGFVHYSQIPKMVGGVENLDDRKLVPVEDVIAEMTAVGGTDEAPRARTHWPVPYRFCSDEYEMGTSTCHVYDDGADPWEIVRSGIQRWSDHYVLDAFRRDKVDFFVDDYAGRAWFRYMHPVATQYQHWLFDSYDPDDFWNPGALWYWLSDWRAADAGITSENWDEDEMGGLTAIEAVRRGIAWLTSVVGNPEPGYYCLNTTKNHYEWVGAATDVDVCETPQGCGTGDGTCADLVIPFGVGRYQWTEYDSDTGYTFYERLRHAGAFYDKVTALEVLADPTTFFIGVDAAQPLNNYVLGTFLAFPKEITQIFGGVAAGRSDVVGWKLAPDGTVMRPDPFRDPALTASWPAIEMPGMYTLRPYAMYYGLAWLNANWDQSFHDTLQIWKVGGSETLALPESATVATLVNPLSNHVYQAGKSPREGWFSAGYEMVLAGKKAADAYAANPSDVYARWDLEDATTFLDLSRGIFDVFGLAWF
ncbi:MAG: zinc-dependent metalloprotease [Deltaproteobacteria bacterium]|nr:zinc-dependent metalloprotease [Deltaproteobacteria bacterium]